MLMPIIRSRRSPSAAAYSRQTFPWTICRSVCPVHCGKTLDRIRMPFGIVGRTGPGMRQVVGFGDRSTGRVFAAHLGRAIVTNGDFTAYVYDSASTVGAAVWGGACGGPRHCCIRLTSCRGRRHFGGFCSPFSQWDMPLGRRQCMFPIRMRILHNISVRQTYRWKARFVWFLAI